MKSTRHGFARIFAALCYSLAGLRAGVTHEIAFRQETILFILLLPVLYLLPASFPIKCLLLAANFLVLIVELLNSAIESVVDLVSPNYHILAKRAKDTASAAVFLSLVLAGCLWIGVIVSLV